MDTFCDLNYAINYSSNTLKTPIQSPIQSPKKKTIDMSTMLSKKDLEKLVSKLNNLKRKQGTFKK